MRINNIKSAGAVDREFIGPIWGTLEYQEHCLLFVFYGTWEALGGCTILTRGVGAICRHVFEISQDMEMCCRDVGGEYLYFEYMPCLVRLGQSGGTKLTVWTNSCNLKYFKVNCRR